MSGNFGNTKGSSLDALSNMLAAASLIPGLDTFTNLASIPVDLARGDFLSAGLSVIGAITHVFVNDPPKGYGIFIENMLSEAEKSK